MDRVSTDTAAHIRASSEVTSQGQLVLILKLIHTEKTPTPGITDTPSLSPSLAFHPLSNHFLSPFSLAVMPAIPGHIHSRLLEARDLWAKAEASLPTDTAVAYMLFTQHNGKLS